MVIESVRVKCAVCGFVGLSYPADYYGVGLRPYVRGCNTSRGKYPPMPQIFICYPCKSAAIGED